MKHLIETLWNAYTLIDLVLILFFSSLSLFYYLRSKKVSKKLKNYQFYSTVSDQTLEDHEHQVKLQECSISELKKAFEDAIVEIMELRSKNKQLIYWKERALHYKHTKKVVDSGWYRCISNHYFPNFEYDGKYKCKETNLNLNSTLICLIRDNGIADIVENKYFKPSTK